METWYRANSYSLSIETVNVVKVTDKFIQLETDGGKTAKIADWISFFSAHDEAKLWLIEKYVGRIAWLQDEIDLANESLQKVYKL